MQVFEPFTLSGLELKNKIVMAPMTRSRAINNIPNDLMKEYYSQRADAGLILSEATGVSANGTGYPRIPSANCAHAWSVPAAGCGAVGRRR